MTKDEAKEIALTIDSFYDIIKGNKFKLQKWVYMLMEFDYKKTERNLNEYIKTNQYPPRISQIAGVAEERISVKEQLMRDGVRIKEDN